MRHHSQQGFTLVELMIVVIIIGVLAAVAIPLYQVAAERSKATEAISAMGLVREALRAHYAEHGTYVNASFTDGASVTVGGILHVSDDDLLGRYFTTECYSFDGAPTATTYLIRCVGDNSTAPAAGEVAGVIRTMDENGDVGQE